MPRTVYTASELRRELPFAWAWRARESVVRECVTPGATWHIVLSEEIMLGYSGHLNIHRLPGDALCGKRHGWAKDERKEPRVLCSPCAAIAALIIEKKRTVLRRDADAEGRWYTVKGS